MRYILTMFLALIVSVGFTQEASFYKLTQVSAYDSNTGRWSEFKPVEGILGTKGNLVRIAVPEYDFEVQFNLTLVDKGENESAVLVKYVDVGQQATIWFYHEKATGQSVVRVTVGNDGLQFIVGKPLGNGD